MENLVGSRIERARAAAAASGWELSVRPVDPEGGNQPEGMVVAQVPRPGTPMNAGSAVAVSVVSRRSWFARHPGALAALAAVAALLVGALAGVAIAAASDDDEPEAMAPDPTVEARVAELSAANTELTTQVETLQAENQALQAQVAELQAGNDELTGQVQSLTAERDQALADLQAAQGTIAGLEEAVADAGDDLTVTESLVGTQLSAAQAYADNRNLELVVSETSTLPSGVSAAAPGTVLEQAPQPGVPVTPGSVIWVEVYVEPEDGGD